MRVKPSRAYWLCQAIGWSLYIATTFAEDLGVGGSRKIIEPVLAAAVGFALTHSFRALALRRRWLAHDLGGLALRVLGAALSIAFLHVVSLSIVELVIYGDRPPSFAIVFVFAWIRWSMVFLVWCAVWFTRALLVEREERARMLREAELTALKAQLNPHFLFNALNAIRALIADEPTRAQDAVTRMARILRYTLGEKEDTVELARELTVVEDYLAIEQLRLGDRLVVERALDAGGRIPMMLLQGLVENAIKHGIARRIDGGTVRITARDDAGVLELTVTNPLPPTRLSTTEGTGLANMRDRLRLLTDDRATLSLDLAGERAVARVRIPQS